MAARTLAIAFAPLGDQMNPTRVSIHVSADPDQWVTEVDRNFDGYTTFQIDDSLGDSDIRIEAAGYRPYQVHFKFRNAVDNANDPKPLNQQVNVGLDIPVPVKLPPPLPPPGELPSLDTRGRDFINHDGSRSVLCGTDMFCAFRQYLNGMDLTPFFAESRELGFNLWRVFMQGSIKQNNILQLSPTEPGYYEHVRPFAELLNRQGIVLLATIGIDNQDIKSPASHWTRMYDLLEGTSTLVSKANEWGKNLGGVRPDELPNPSGNILWSQGSGLQDEAPFKPTGKFMEFHQVRNFPTSIRDTVASATEIQDVLDYPEIPLIMDEPAKFGTDGNYPEPRDSYNFARCYATFWAGAVFHNWNGQRGQLMDANTKACAREWVRGMKLG